MKVAFIGLGVMGYPMAGHLQKAGHEVCVFNRSQAKADKWLAEFSGTSSKTPALAAKDCEIVFCCVGNDDDLRQVVLGENGILAGMPKGSILVDHTTASAEVAVELAGIAASQEQYFLDAPVSGGQAGAENGKLTVMVGGDDAAFAAALPLMECYGARVVHMGGAGKGQQAKMVNQICIAGLVQALSEGLSFAMDAGLDTDKLLEAISGGAAQSWQMVNRGETMVKGEFDFGFAVDWMRKDLRICLEEAKRNGADLPVTEIVAGYYAELSADGFGRNDTSSLIRRLRQF